MSLFAFFFFFFQLGHDLGRKLGPNLVRLNGAGARGARLGRSGPREKNPFNKRAGFGLRVLTRGSGPGMKKPDPNPTRCHSYLHLINYQS